MVSDLKDLEGLDLFTLKPNWGTTPKTNLKLMRRIVEFVGTSSSLQTQGNVPIFSMDLGFILKSRVEMNTFLDFMHDHLGRNYRFWMRHPKSFFTLKQTAGPGSTLIYVDRNKFDWIYQGYERIYFQLGNGDVITRLITSVVEDVGNDRLELHFTDALDRNIFKTDRFILGRLLLVRFDQDEFSIKIKTQTLSEATIRTVELIQEYSEI